MGSEKKKNRRSWPRRWARRLGLTVSILSVLTLAVFVLDCATTSVPFEGQRLAEMESSQNWDADGGRFVNELPRASFDMWSSLAKTLRGVDFPRPQGLMEVPALTAASFAAAPASGLRVTWLGHSTSLIEIDGARVLLDPIWSERASPFGWAGPRRFHAPPLPMDELIELGVDVVAISHDHYDHLDQSTIERLATHVPLFVVPLGVGAYLEKWGVPTERIEERDWWGEVEAGPLRLVITPSRHFSGRSLVMARADRTLWGGVAIIGPKHRVYFSGDTGMFPGFAEIGERLGPFDITLIETGAYDALWADIHLGPEQAVMANRMVRGRLYMPVHWGTFSLAPHNWTEPVERAVAAADRWNVAIATPYPGRSFEPTVKPLRARWWPSLPWRTAQEEPIVSGGLEPELVEQLHLPGASPQS